MAQEATARNVRFLDAPVAGSKQPAAEGTLLFIVGGKEEDVATAQPLFDVMGRQVIHVGDNGMGTSLKLVFNLLLAQAMLGFAEAMTLGEALGFEQERLFEILIGGPLVAPFIAGKRPLLASGDYEAAFPLKWLTKDVHLAIQTAYELGIALPSGNVTEAVYRLAARHGWREEDFSAIYAFIGEDG
jgi:3-hydroxyisobutyrate dehydrogenase/glyoxylate/succinic semialdehyde reductase